MTCIKKISDEDFLLSSIPLNNPRIRFASRGIVLNDKSEVAVLHKKNKNEYKLIGGGIEDNEEPTKAFIREVFEETGYNIIIDSYVGTIEEYKTLDNFKQISHIYISHVVDKVKTPCYTVQEIAEGSELLWLNLSDALNIIKDCENNLVGSKYDGNMSIYHTKFIVRRDYEILKYYIEKYKKNKIKNLVIHF